MFYGWWVAFACFLLVVASAPSHSFGINTFVPFFVRRVTREQVSTVWLLASFFSAALVPLAGAAIDGIGARRTATLVAPLYVATLFVLGTWVTSAVQLAACVAMLRFLGAEVLNILAKTTVQRWFTRHVGRAAAFLSVGGAILVTMPALLAPVLTALRGDWHALYRLLSGIFGALLAVALWLLRDYPHNLGLRPDGAASLRACGTVELDSVASTDGTEAKGALTGGAPWRRDAARPRGVVHHAPLRANTLKQAVWHPLYWSLALSLSGYEVFWAGFNFHFVEAASGLTSGHVSPASLARAYYLPLTLAFNGADIVVGVALTDRLTPIGRVRALGVLNACCALVMGGLPRVSTEGALIVFALTYGLVSGGREALLRVSLSSLFGTEALGRLEGLHQGISVCSTGMGPLLWAASLSAGGPGRIVGASCLLLLGAALATLLFSRWIVPLAPPEAERDGEQDSWRSELGPRRAERQDCRCTEIQ